MDFCKLGLEVIKNEASAVLELTHRLDHKFNHACEILLACTGRVVVTGMGKSGHIGKKIAATLSSTGTPAFFMHPGEASHGDMGMIIRNDTVLAISNSGETQELLVLLPVLKRLSVSLVTLTGNPTSSLAAAADVNLDVSINQEACPLGLAPTTSTTVSLVMGDALAIALLQARGFDANDFAFSHPGGMLGKRLLLRIDDIWSNGDNLPVVSEDHTVLEALILVNQKHLGMTCVINAGGELVGVFTDGDIRRTLLANDNLNTTPLHKVMTRSPLTITQGILAAEALEIMQTNNVTCLIVVDANKRPQAVVHLHALLRAGIY